MIFYAVIAFIGGVLVIVSRQINGRLSLFTSAMHASFWNHLVGLLVLTLFALIFGGLFTAGIKDVPAWAYWGGPIGVVFIALSSWLVTRIGAAQTAMLIIAGQMIFGVLLDIVMGAPGVLWARLLGVALILMGMWLNHHKRPNPRGGGDADALN